MSDILLEFLIINLNIITPLVITISLLIKLLKKVQPVKVFMEDLTSSQLKISLLLLDLVTIALKIILA